MQEIQQRYVHDNLRTTSNEDTEIQWAKLQSSNAVLYSVEQLVHKKLNKRLVDPHTIGGDPHIHPTILTPLTLDLQSHTTTQCLETDQRYPLFLTPYLRLPSAYPQPHLQPWPDLNHPGILNTVPNEYYTVSNEWIKLIKSPPLGLSSLSHPDWKIHPHPPRRSPSGRQRLMGRPRWGRISDTTRTLDLHS